MLGISNQLLACISLTAVTTMLVNRGKARYAWVTLLPLLFVGTATETAGYQLIVHQFIPKMILSGKPGLVVQGWLLSGLCAMAMVALLYVLGEAALKWLRWARSPSPQGAA